MDRAHPIRQQGSLAAFSAFAFQVIVGAVTFFIIYSVALLVAAALRLLSDVLQAPPWLRQVGEWIEVVIFAGDMIGFLLLMVVEITNLATRLWDDWRTLRD